MPKAKTNRSAAKRFTVTKSGKIKFKKQGLRHILTLRTRKSKRQKRPAGYLGSADTSRLKKGLPYS